MGIHISTNSHQNKHLQTKFIMKLQLTLLTLTISTLALSKNIPVPKVKKPVQQKLNNLQRNIGNKVGEVFSDVQKQAKGFGLNIDPEKTGINSALKKAANNAQNAAKPQINNMKKQAEKEFDALSKKFGNWDIEQIIKTADNNLNAAIDEAEEKAPAGAKSFIDIGQKFLGALADAGKEALGDNKDLTLNNLMDSGKKAAEGAINSKAANNALKNMNKAVKGN